MGRERRGGGKGKKVVVGIGEKENESRWNRVNGRTCDQCRSYGGACAPHRIVIPPQLPPTGDLGKSKSLACISLATFHSHNVNTIHCFDK